MKGRPLGARIERLDAALMPSPTGVLVVIGREGETRDQAIARAMTERGLKVRPRAFVVLSQADLDGL
jgi:hypothetical protein